MEEPLCFENAQCKNQLPGKKKLSLLLKSMYQRSQHDFQSTFCGKFRGLRQKFLYPQMKTSHRLRMLVLLSFTFWLQVETFLKKSTFCFGSYLVLEPSAANNL